MDKSLFILSLVDCVLFLLLLLGSIQLILKIIDSGFEFRFAIFFAIELIITHGIIQKHSEWSYGELHSLLIKLIALMFVLITCNLPTSSSNSSIDYGDGGDGWDFGDSGDSGDGGDGGGD